MWPPWARSPRRDTATTTSTSTASISSLFRFSAMKGIHSLLTDGDETPDPVDARKPSVFHRVRIASSALRAWRSLPPSPPPAADKRIVVYFTSLRVVRKTFEDCRAVRSILRGFRVSMDERDLSMDSGFLNELKSILGRKQLGLPRVFIGGRYVGGADEIRQLHESGELKNYVEGLMPDTGDCDSCGGIRFMLCQTCNGSHKFYTEKAGFRTCTACNENGLVRCPECCLYESI